MHQLSFIFYLLDIWLTARIWFQLAYRLQERQLPRISKKNDIPKCLLPKRLTFYDISLIC